MAFDVVGKRIIQFIFVAKSNLQLHYKENWYLIGTSSDKKTVFPKDILRKLVERAHPKL